MRSLAVIIICSLVIALGCADGSKNDKSRSSNKSATSSSKAKKESKSETKPIPEKHLTKAKELIGSTPASDIDAVNAQKVFKGNCAICHGFKGNMKLNGAKDLTASKINLENAVAQVYFGRGLMQPYKGILSDAEIIAVSTYTESLRN